MNYSSFDEVDLNELGLETKIKNYTSGEISILKNSLKNLSNFSTQFAHINKNFIAQKINNKRVRRKFSSNNSKIINVNSIKKK